MIVNREHWRIKNNLCLFLLCSNYDVKTISFRRIITLIRDESYMKTPGSGYVLKIGNESVEQIKPLSLVHNCHIVYISEKIDINNRPPRYSWIKKLLRKLLRILMFPL